MLIHRNIFILISFPSYKNNTCLLKKEIQTMKKHRKLKGFHHPALQRVCVHSYNLRSNYEWGVGFVSLTRTFCSYWSASIFTWFFWQFLTSTLRTSFVILFFYYLLHLTESSTPSRVSINTCRVNGHKFLFLLLLLLLLSRFSRVRLCATP